MYRLYWARNTGAFAPEAAMTLAGVPFERLAVDTDAGEHQGEAYRRLNPMGQVPLLILPDGTAMTESAAMLLHLADRFPEAGLAPAPGTRPMMLPRMLDRRNIQRSAKSSRKDGSLVDA